MMRCIIYAILFLASASLQAQTFEKAVFTHKTKQKTRTLEAGDRLTVKYLDKGKIKLATSKLQLVEDGVLYLFDRPAIPLDNVITIRYRDAGFSRDLLTIFIFGMLLTCIGFLWAAVYIFIYAPPVAGWLMGIGLFLIFLSFIIQVIGTHHIRHAGTAWEVETVMKPAPLQSP